MNEIDELESSDEDHDYGTDNNLEKTLLSGSTNTSQIPHKQQYKKSLKGTIQQRELSVQQSILVDPPKRKLTSSEPSPMKQSKANDKLQNSSKENTPTQGNKYTSRVLGESGNTIKSESLALKNIVPRSPTPPSPIPQDEVQAYLFLHPELKRPSSMISPAMNGSHDDSDDNALESSDPGDEEFFKYYNSWDEDAVDPESDKEEE